MLEDENSSQEYAKAVAYIYELINNGTLEVGSRLPTERSISVQLGIGRNSTREALSILHGMGIIERKQGSGNYISGDAGKSISQIILMMLALRSISYTDVCEFRRILEKTVCSMIVKNGISKEHSERLKGYLDELWSIQNELKAQDSDAEGEAGTKKLLRRLAAADDNFHNELVRAADNGLMTVIMDAVTAVYMEFIEHIIYNTDMEKRDKLIDCHKSIYEGIMSSDNGMIETAIDMHYDMVSAGGIF